MLSKAEETVNTEWTANDVKSTITNPVYTGMGPYPLIIGDDRWLDTTVRMIKEDGAKIVITSVLDHLMVNSPPCTLDAELYINQAQHDPRAALIHLLTDMQDLAQEKSK